MSTSITIPELGEGVDSVDVIAVLVAAGDTIEIDQPLIEVESAKAAVEVPATHAGTVTQIHVETGQTLGPGALILTIEAQDSNAETQSRKDTEPSQKEVDPTPASESDPNTDGQLNVATTKAQRHKDDHEDSADFRRVGLGPPSPAAAPETLPANETATEPETKNSKLKTQNSMARLVPAAPTVRRFAREVGMDITAVKGSGPGGRISIDDVKTAVAKRLDSGPGGTGLPSIDLPDFSRWGEIRREPMTKIRKLTAEAMTRAWLTAPQVTNHDLADITELEETRRAFKRRVEAAGGALTTTAILVKTVASALKRFPTLNASVDTSAEEIILKSYVTIGVAVDTDHGLLVPVIKNADRKNITEIAVELTDLATRARSRKLKPDEMQGGTFSISNLGGIGGTGFSPIVNWPEVAILGVSRSRVQPEWDDELEKFEPRRMLPLSLSYDHRLVDGADAARFLRWLTEALESPLLLALEG